MIVQLSINNSTATYKKLCSWNSISQFQAPGGIQYEMLRLNFLINNDGKSMDFSPRKCL